MDAQIEKVIAETVKEFGEEQASPAIRAAVNLALWSIARKNWKAFTVFQPLQELCARWLTGRRKGKQREGNNQNAA